MKVRSFLCRTPQDCPSFSDFNPSFFFVFFDTQFDIHSLIERLRINYPDATIVGCSSKGEIIDKPPFTFDGVAVLLATDIDAFKVHFFDLRKSTEQLLSEVKEFKKAFRRPFFIAFLSFPIADLDIGFKVDRVLEELDNCFGGLVGEPYEKHGGIILCNGDFWNRGIVAIAMDAGRYFFDYALFHGYESVKKLFKITSAEGRYVFEVEEEPAFDFFSKYYTSDDLRERLAFPLMLVDRESRGYTPLTVVESMSENEKWVLLKRSILRERFAFGVPSFHSYAFLEKELRRFGSLKEITGFSLVFSCIGRRILENVIIKVENKEIVKVAEKPTAGFFTLGGIAPLPGETKPFIHSLTTMVLFILEACEA